MARVLYRPEIFTPIVSRARIAGGLAAALWLTTGIAGQAAAPPPASSAAAIYQQARARFDAGDLSGAEALLKRAPKTASKREQADITNLRGAIDLRQHRYDQAQEEFARAASGDPNLWAARYNAAEVSFRRGRYDEASQLFHGLLDHTTGFSQSRERQFAQYKMLLAEMQAGREQNVQRFLSDHRDDKTPPPGYYYLSAALERKHGHPQKAAEWLAQADGKRPAASPSVFAESLQDLGGSAESDPRLAASANPRAGNAAHPAAGGENAARRSASGDEARGSTPASVAMVELMPGESTRKADAPKPAFRTEADHPPVPSFRGGEHGPQDLDAQMPPVVDAAEPQTLVESSADARLGLTGPAVLGKPSSNRKSGKATPTPSASPSDSPAPGDSPSASPSASPAASASPTPGATPSPAFVQKYEAAYVKYLEKDYKGAVALLDEADALQAGQKSSSDLRDLIFKAYYESAYVSFRKGDYAAALEQLGNADEVKPSNPDSLNLRGLVLSRQHSYEAAEAAFKKASQLDPTFYAAKFNYAELPFNYRNYTVARARFEDLFSQTDPAKQPVEAEITQFKVFLTLLLEGKVDQARQNMEHFNFTGATPARYFCQAALDFYAGNMDKATGWVDSASKEFQPRLVAVFKESFYRIGWMTEAGGAGNAVAAAPGAAPSASPGGTPPAVALATPGPVALPTGSPAAVVALNNGKPVATVPPTPAASVAPSAPAVALAKPSPAATKPPLAAPTPTAPAVAVISPSPTPAASKSPVAVPTPAAPAVAVATPSPTPAASRPPLAVPTPSVAPSVAIAAATPVPTPKPAATPLPTLAKPLPATPGPTPALAKATPTPEGQPSPAAEAAGETASQDYVRFCWIFGAVLVVVTMANMFLLLNAAAKRRDRRLAARRRFVYSDAPVAEEPEEVESPR